MLKGSCRIITITNIITIDTKLRNHSNRSKTSSPSVLVKSLCSWLLFVVIALFLNSSMVAEADKEQSMNYLIEGVYSLINQNRPELAEMQFQRAIAEDETNAEAYYFLGKLSYSKGLSLGSKEFIGKALAYLTKADEYRIKYDRLHPNLLGEIQLRYPMVKAIPESLSKASLKPHATAKLSPAPKEEDFAYPLTKVIIEGSDVDDKAVILEQLGMNRKGEADEPASGFILPTPSVDSSQRDTTARRTYRFGEEMRLKGGATYQLSFDKSTRQKGMLLRIVCISALLSVWLVR